MGDDQRSVFLLWHAREVGPPTFHEDFKLIGVYRTEKDARAAQARVAEKSGFRDYPDGFEISEYELDQDHWLEGFVGISDIDEPGSDED